MGNDTIIENKAEFETTATIFLDKIFKRSGILNGLLRKTILVKLKFGRFQMDSGRSNIIVKPPRMQLK